MYNVFLGIKTNAIPWYELFVYRCVSLPSLNVFQCFLSYDLEGNTFQPKRKKNSYIFLFSLINTWLPLSQFSTNFRDDSLTNLRLTTELWFQVLCKGQWEPCNDVEKTWKPGKKNMILSTLCTPKFQPPWGNISPNHKQVLTVETYELWDFYKTSCKLKTLRAFYFE